MPISAIPSNLERIGDRSSTMSVDVRPHVDDLDGACSVPTVADAQPSRARVIGHSREWRQVLKKASQVAGTDTTVFL
jgi:hypothetical protein